MTDEEDMLNSSDLEDDEVPKYRMITTFNAQLTKWTFLLCGIAIGFLFARAYLHQPKFTVQIEACQSQQEETSWTSAR